MKQRAIEGFGVRIYLVILALFLALYGGLELGYRIGYATAFHHVAGK